MKTAEAKTTSVATSQRANQPFFSMEAAGSFFAKSSGNGASFFTPSSAYSVNDNGVLQTKLNIGLPNDRYEKEADAMADKVVQRLAVPEPFTKKDTGIQTKPLAANITPWIQKRCASCEQEEQLQKKEEAEEQDLVKNKLQKKPIVERNEPLPTEKSNVQQKCGKTENMEPVQAKATVVPLVIQAKCNSCEQEDKLQKKEEEDLVQELPLELQRKPIFESNAEPPDDENNIQRKCVECEKEKKVQTKANPASPATAPSDIENRLHSSKGGGASIADNTLVQMESAFGVDFSKVRLHTDSAAVQMNKDLHAQAFTHGSDIYFNVGKYDTNSAGGKHLLAHELTHTLQQTGMVHKADDCTTYDPGEIAASRSADGWLNPDVILIAP